MSSKQQLTDESLIDLLEKQRCTFTDRYRPLLTIQETAVRKANDLVAEPPESLKRNYSKKKANTILNDIKNCISYDVFVLCALATNPSALGTSKLGDYVLKVGRWWEGVHHPKGLTIVSERYGTRISKPSPTGKPTSDELPESQPSRSMTSQHSVAQGTDSFGPERSAAVQSPALWLQQDLIIPTAQPFQLDGLQNGPETRSQHGHALIRDMRDPTLQNQPDTTTHYQVPDERLSKRPWLASQQIPGNLELPGQGQYYSFSFTRRYMIENLPEPFCTGMKMSNLWRKEKERGGLAVTNCLSMYLPERINEDALFVVRLGHDDAFNICNMFGLGEPDTSESGSGRRRS